MEEQHSPQSFDTDVLIVGAGPIGLASALFLGKLGIRAMLVERKETPREDSRAIGMTPPSLEILENFGISSRLVAEGTPIRTVRVANETQSLGQVSFAAIPGDYPFILSIPQVKTERILAEALAAYPSVSLLRGWELRELRSEKLGAEAKIASVSQSDKERVIRAHFILGCDGAKSDTRNLLRVRWRGHRYPYTFVMGDFEDEFNWVSEGRLWFTRVGAVESFPLPDSKRRWIVQTRRFVETPDKDLISCEVKARAGISPSAAKMTWQSAFGVQRGRAAAYRRGRIFLLGDAAHVMSPIGGQGMNTGFADVELLLPTLARIVTDLAKSTKPVIAHEMKRVFRTWERMRKRAFRVAANRAWFSMRLGTITGHFFPKLRDAILSFMIQGPIRSRLPRDYAMLTIPFRNARAVAAKKT